MKGKVIQTTGSWYKVLCEDGRERDARLRGRFKTQDMRFTNPIAVGDDVQLHNAEDATGVVIDHIFNRSNYIIRQSPRKKFHQHIIAANIDLALLMVSIYSPRTSLGFIDRFITASESFHIPVHLLINKIDLLKPKHQAVLEDWMEIYSSIGYPVYTASVENEQGLDEVNKLLEGSVTLLAGHSGVGKSSLINRLAPDLDLRVNTISDKYNKGKHTTTFATMHQLRPGTFIIDTPGIKEFGLSQIEPGELSGYFVEMKDLITECRYNNCLHRDEPGCAVKAAVQDGKIAESRFLNYLQILDSLEAVNYWERS